VITVSVITELHFVNNYSTGALTITNLEKQPGDPDYMATCPPGGSTFIEYMWVPWCSTGSEFSSGHHMVITVSGVTSFVWQDRDTDGNWVRLSTTGFARTLDPPYAAAPHFPGIAANGGDRNIDVAPNGSITLVDAAPTASTATPAP
jgi:hypothetical protein